MTARTQLTDALGVDFPELAQLVNRFAAAGQTVATAESLTGGLIAATLTCVPGSSAVVRGGLVVYATDLKNSLAGVDAELLAEVGAVHPAVAAQLAAGVRLRCSASWGLGITGVAGPDPQDGQPVGTVYTCLSDGLRSIAHTDLHPGDRSAVRAAAVRRALDLLRQAVL